MDKFSQAICAFSNYVSGNGNRMKVLGYVNRFSRGVYRVQKELLENGNGRAEFDFSLITAFRVVENVSKQFFEEEFGTETTQYTTTQENQHNIQETPKKSQRKIGEELMDLLVLEPHLTVRQIAERLDKTGDNILYYLRKITEKGIIKRE